MRVTEDREWLLENVRALTNAQERSRGESWSIEQAPADYIKSLLGSIVGVEIAIERLEGKWKMSQNRGATDREGVIRELLKIAGGRLPD